MLIQSELVATYSYEVLGKIEPFLFRLEIYKHADTFKGVVFRLDRYRFVPTFPQNSNGEPTGVADDALVYVKDEFIDDRDLVGRSKEEVVSIFSEKLRKIFKLDDGVE